MSFEKTKELIALNQTSWYQKFDKRILDSSEEFDGWTSKLQAEDLYEKVFQEIKDALEKNDQTSILDVGCGEGRFYDYLLDKGYADKIKYTGVEIRDDAIKKFRARHSKVDIIKEDFLSKDFTKQSFDIVTSIGALSITANGLTDEEVMVYTENFMRKLFDISKTSVQLISNSMYICQPPFGLGFLAAMAYAVSPFIKLSTMIKPGKNVNFAVIGIYKNFDN